MAMNILCMIVGLCFGILLHLILKTPNGPYYFYKGKMYAFIEKGKMKDHLGEWVDCVFYRSTKDNILYARETSQFYRIFRPVKMRKIKSNPSEKKSQGKALSLHKQK